MNTTLVKFGRALLFALISVSAGSALATTTFGTRVDSYCAARPAQASVPQQSRPYRASGSSCFLCHTGSPSRNNLNTFGDASNSCTSSTCGAAVNPFCVAHAPSNASITAPAAGTSVAQGQSLTFTAANATNPDGFPLTYTWLFSGGMPDVTGRSVSVAMSVAGSITSTLEVRNSVGMLATGTPPTRTVTVTGGTANQAPVATISAPGGNETIAQGGTVTFQGAGSDPDGNTPLTYNWNFDGGAANSTAQNPGAVTFNTAGTYTVTFTVTDSLGLASAAVTRTITVTGVTANQPPVATIVSPSDNETVTQGGSLNFQGFGSDPDGNTPLSYHWDFGGGAADSTLQNPGAVTFNTAGTFTVSFTATDSLGLASAPAVLSVMVTAPQGPVATIVRPAMNVSVLPGGKVKFRAAAPVAGSGTLSYRWNFPGGEPSSSTSQHPAAVKFANPGNYTVTLTVTDRRGRVSTAASRVITVAAPARNPSLGEDCLKHDEPREDDRDEHEEHEDRDRVKERGDEREEREDRDRAKEQGKDRDQERNKVTDKKREKAQDKDRDD